LIYILKYQWKKSSTERGYSNMSLPWHKLNHKRQNYYIILGALALASVSISVIYLVNKF